jgi:hypothetical protein
MTAFHIPSNATAIIQLSDTTKYELLLASLHKLRIIKYDDYKTRNHCTTVPCHTK